MLLNFTLNGRTLIFNNPSALVNETQINYIQCRIQLNSEVFTPNDTLVAVFKSASYQSEEEVLLDTFHGSPYSFVFIPSKVFEHGGVIQMLIYKYRNAAGRYNAQESTNTLEFFVDPSKYVPLRTSAIVQQLANEFQEVRTQVMDMTVDAYESDSLSVTKSIIDGAINLSFGLVKGPQGDPGPQGIQGIQGPIGEDGVGITSITKTGTSGLVDTYTITYTDSTTSTYNVTNGQDGEPGTTDYEELINTPDLAEVATSGDYEDLTNTPTIPDAVSVTQLTSTGTNIADITVGNTTTHLYAPEGGSDEIFVAQYGVTTYAEVCDAYDDGLMIVMKRNQSYAPLYNRGTLSDSYVFNFYGIASYDSIKRYVLNTDGWHDESPSYFVEVTRTVNGKALSTDITLTASDVGAQAVLVSGTNIKTINNESILGSGNISISGGTEEIFVAEYGVTTYADVLASYNDGKIIFVNDTNDFAPLINIGDLNGSSIFNFLAPITSTEIRRYNLDSSGWGTFTTTVVPSYRKVNNKALSSDITLTASDVGALPDNTAIPTNVSDLVNDSGFITGYTETDPVFSASAAAGITSSDITSWNGKSNFSGSYTDLTNKPTIPTKVSDLINDSGFTTPEIFWATYGTTTSAEIEAAYQADKIVCVKKGEIVYTLTIKMSATSHMFAVNVSGDLLKLRCINDVWTTDATYLVPLDSNDKIIDYYLPDYHDIFWVTYGTTTNSEISAALVAGKVPVVAIDYHLLVFKSEFGANNHRFSCFDNGTEYYATCTSNTWGVGSQTFVPVDSNGKIPTSYLPVYNGGVS